MINDTSIDCASSWLILCAGNRRPIPLLASDLTKLLPYAARLALECIGNGDALYHDIEHTMLVTLVGHDILGWTCAATNHHGHRLCKLHLWPASPMTLAMCGA